MSFQKTKPITEPQRFVELYVVVDNTEVNITLIPLQLSFHCLINLITCLSFLFLQYKRYGSETKSRILEVINHVDKVGFLSVGAQLFLWFCAIVALSRRHPSLFISEKHVLLLLLRLQLYRPLNIRVMLVGLEIWSYRDYIDVDINSETALDNFLIWRQADLLQRTKHDNAQFVT